MSQIRTYERSFATGEITPELFGRVDLPKAQEGVALCRNFVALPHGPLQNRAGTQYVAAVKTSANATRVIPFTFNNSITYAIQFGAGYFRFHSQGSTVLSGGVPYEIANSYAEADLFSVRFEQYGNKVTLTHPSYAPQELTCTGATSWALTTPSFNPPAATNLGAAPTGVAYAGTGGPGTVTNNYMVTGVLATTLEETMPTGASAAVTNDLSLVGAYNTISITDSGSLYVRYNFYKLFQGLYGYIGQAAGASPVAFVDQNIYPDTSITPPISDVLFQSAGNYPAAVGYHEQRRGLAGTNNDPQKAWFTRVGTDSNMSYNIPVRDDSRIAFRIAARESNQIKHIVSMQDLILLSGACEWRVTSNGQAFTPSTVSVKPQSYVGCNEARPVVVGNMLLFAAARGGHLNELSYAWQSASYTTSDASVLAGHLFDGWQIIEMALTRGNPPIVWCVSTNGKLLGMTYLPDRQVIAWHQHDTGNGDIFESVCAITENNDEVLYTVVNRLVNGSYVRYVEMLHSRQFTALADAFFVDSGMTFYNTGTFARAGTAMTCTINGHGLTDATAYSFAFSDTSFGLAPTGTSYTVTVVDQNTFTIVVANAGATSGTVTQQVTSVSGLSWLEQRAVNILADGAVCPAQVVTGGVITIPFAAAKITIGIPIQAQAQTAPIASVVDSASGQGRPKNVNKVWLRVNHSSGIKAGPDFSTLRPFAQRTIEPYGSPPNMVSDEIEIVVDGEWATSGQTCIQQDDPLPLTLVSETIEAVIGGG